MHTYKIASILFCLKYNVVERAGIGFRAREIWVQILAIQESSCVTFSVLLNLSESHIASSIKCHLI